MWCCVAWDCVSQEKVKGTDILLSNIFYDWDKCIIRWKGSKLSKRSACYQLEGTRQTKQFHQEKSTHIGKRSVIKLLQDMSIKLLYQSGELPIKLNLLLNLDFFFFFSENISMLKCTVCIFQTRSFLAFSFCNSSLWSIFNWVWNSWNWNNVLKHFHCVKITTFMGFVLTNNILHFPL